MRKIIIIMALALVAFTSMAAPRTTKKRHKKVQQVERVERYDSAYVTLYGETPEGILREYIEKADGMVDIYRTVASVAPIDHAILTEYEAKCWRWYSDVWGETLRKDPDVWKAFLDAFDVYTNIAF